MIHGFFSGFHSGYEGFSIMVMVSSPVGLPALLGALWDENPVAAVPSGTPSGYLDLFGGFHKWWYPKNAGWFIMFISWNIPLKFG
jgi:hypothetical protein